MANTMTIDRRGPTNDGNGVIGRVGRNDRDIKLLNLPKV